MLTQYDPVPGSHTGDVEARLAALDSEGVTTELAFPNSVLALFGWPDREIRERCFRIYNEHIAEVQERSGNRIYGVGLINWWDAAGRAADPGGAQGPRTEDVPAAPVARQGHRQAADRLRQHRHGRRVGGDRGVTVPVVTPHRRDPPPTPNEFNAVGIGMLQSVAPFRDLFGKYIARRHPRPPPGAPASAGSKVASTGCRRRFRTLSTSRIVPAPRQPRRSSTTRSSTGTPHVCVVHGRPARARADRPDRRRPRDVVDRLPAQREHLRLQHRVAGRRGRSRRAATAARRSSATTSSASSGWAAVDRGSDGGRASRPHPGPRPTSTGCARPRVTHSVDHARAGSRRAWCCSATPTSCTPPARSGRWPMPAGSNFEQPVAVVLADDEYAASVLADPDRRPAARRAAGRSPARSGAPGLRRGCGALRRHGSPTCSHRGASSRSTNGRTPCAARGLLLGAGAAARRRPGDQQGQGRSRRRTSSRACGRGCASPSGPSPQVQARVAPGCPADRSHGDVPAYDLRCGRRRQHPRPDLADHAAAHRRRAVDDDR